MNSGETLRVAIGASRVSSVAAAVAMPALMIATSSRPPCGKVFAMNQSLPVNAPEYSSGLRHWSARLELAFGNDGDRTRLRRCEHAGPLRVQRLFHPDASGKAHCYLLHPPGGVVLGDDLAIGAAVENGAALLTTPSAGRFYDVGSSPQSQRQRVRLRVKAGLLEWLPQETILFPGARAVLDTTIDLEDDALLAYWDILVLGRPACGEGFDRGSVLQRLLLRRCGRPVLAERLALTAGDRLCRAAAGLRGASTVGIAVFTVDGGEELLEDWRIASNGGDANGDFCVTQRGELLVARYLGDDAQRCREGFALLWQRLAQLRDGFTPAQPRIWHT